MDMLLKVGSNFDDTFLYIGIGALLSKSKFHDTYGVWVNNTPDISPTLKLLSKYAYRPFSKDANNNMIAPYSYYVLRDLISEMEEQKRTSFSIPLEFVLNYDDTSSDRLPISSILLFSNFLDLSTCANILHALTAAVLNNFQSPEKWFDEDIQEIYKDIVDMEVYFLTHNFSNRVDIALARYPQPLQFMWLLSRTVQLLTSTDKIMFPVLVAAKDSLINAMRASGTKFILDFSHTDFSDLVYFDGFLGNSDVNLNGEYSVQSTFKQAMCISHVRCVVYAFH